MCLQHEAGHAAYEDAKKKIVEINATVETKTSAVKDIESELVKVKLDASEARKLEQVSCYHGNLPLCFLLIPILDNLGPDFELAGYA